MTGKSSKTGSRFDICFHYCIDLKLRMEDYVYLSSVTLNLMPKDFCILYIFHLLIAL